MRKVFASILILCCVLAAGCSSVSIQSASAAADPSWNDVKTANKLVIGIEESFYPMTYTNENGNPAGFGVDVATEVCRRLGIAAEFEPVIWSEAQDALDGGEIDCIWTSCSAVVSVQDPAYPHTGGYLAGSQAVLCLTESGAQNLADLKGQRIGVKRNSCGEQALEQSTAFRDSLASVNAYDDYESAKQSLDNKKISAVVMDYAAARYYQNQQPGIYTILSKNGGEEPEVLATDEYCVSFRQGAESLSLKIEETLAAMRNDGTLDTYQKKWFGSEFSPVSSQL